MSKKSWMEGIASDPRHEPVPEVVRPQRGRKDTKRWCKGKVGREHQPKTVVHHYYSNSEFWKSCGQTTYWMSWSDPKGIGSRWRCYHAVQCQSCGKYLDTYLPQEECPTWQQQHSSPSVS